MSEDIRSGTGRKIRVLIIGAGPSGLLAAILLLRRNAAAKLEQSPEKPVYEITIVDPGIDHGDLDFANLRRRRSWMIGLSFHGIKAIRSVPGLYEDYVKASGVDLKNFTIGLTNTFKIEVDLTKTLPPESVFSIDRNFICAALARYLNTNFKFSAEFIPRYNTKALFVDVEKKRVVVRSTGKGLDDNDMHLDYDLLLGCDGIRSVVRNSFLIKHRDFEFSLSDTFTASKCMHLKLPRDVKEATYMYLSALIPNSTSFIMPETDNLLNAVIVFPKNKPIAKDLLSEDPSVVSAYFKKHSKMFALDCDEIGKQWVSQGWNSISQVYCNFYHSIPLCALLLGDAAHATSPRIGQGMNTALADASALNNLLNVYNDDIEKVLLEFSKLRVKEGNALTALSFYTASKCPSQQLLLLIKENTWAFFHRRIPWLVGQHPMRAIYYKNVELSVVYDKMTKLGIIPSVRQVNDSILREHFEMESGMITSEDKKGARSVMKLYAIFIITAVWCLYSKNWLGVMVVSTSKTFVNQSSPIF